MTLDIAQNIRRRWMLNLAFFLQYISVHSLRCYFIFLHHLRSWWDQSIHLSPHEAIWWPHFLIIHIFSTFRLIFIILIVLAFTVNLVIFCVIFNAIIKKTIESVITITLLQAKATVPASSLTIGTTMYFISLSYSFFAVSVKVVVHLRWYWAVMTLDLFIALFFYCPTCILHVLLAISWNQCCEILLKNFSTCF